MVGPHFRSLGDAISDFRSARSKAAMQAIFSTLRGEKNQLLSYDEVRKQLKAQGSAERGLHDIPLDAIVGSVGRYTDFNRNFLPLGSVSPERWARVKLAASDLAGLPPIEVYQIGSVYFVKDGNHRVSVARQLGADHIQAYVTEVRTRVPLTPDVNPDDLILKAEYAGFLEQTRLDQLRPEAELTVTAPGKYEDLLEHISVHRYFMGIDFQREIPYEEAVVHWYDTVYLPIVQMIRERGILRYFPDRTETDLYLWIGQHQAELEDQVGWKVDPGEVVTDLVDSQSPSREKVVARLGGKLLERISLDRLSPGPPAGEWRRRRGVEESQPGRLFTEILVAIGSSESGWNAVEQALLVAEREGARLHGLHVVQDNDQIDSQETQALRQRFEARSQEAGIPSDLAVAAGEISREICSRARWADLLVANLAFPPSTQPFARLGHGFRDLIQRCPLPILATPGAVWPLERPLLAFDGSPKAREALFVATYLSGRWQVPLTVVTVAEGTIGLAVLDQAREYLEEHGIEATYTLESGPVAEAVLKAARIHECDLIVMGGYGMNPVMEVALGGSVDSLLRTSDIPMLICR